MIVIKKNTKQMVSVVLLAFVAMAFCPQVVNAQKQKKFDEAIAKGWIETKGYEYSEKVDNEKKREKFKENAEKMGYIIHYFGVSSVYFCRPDEKQQLDREVIIARNRQLFPKLVENNKSEWIDLTADFKTKGKAFIVEVEDYPPSSSVIRDTHTHRLSSISDVNWTGEISNGLLEGEGTGYVLANNHHTTYLFKGTFHNGLMMKGKVLRKGEKEFMVESSPSVDGMTWVKDNAHKDGKWTYFLVDKNYSNVINCGISAVKRDFQNGTAIVTLRGVDIEIDKRGGLVAICEGTTEIPDNFLSSIPQLRHSKSKSLVIPSTVTKIGEEALRFLENVESLVIPNSVTRIGRSAFNGCKSLKNVNIGNGIRELPFYVFYYCENLENCTLSDNLIIIGESAFNNCMSLKSINLPKTLKRIDDQAFSSCPITSVTLPESLERIGNEVFGWCKRLTSATVPSRLIEIIKGKKIFWACDNLKSVKVIDRFGKIKEDSEWYWKNNMSKEEKARRDAEIASHEENKYDFPLPNSKVDQSDTDGWPGILDYDLSLQLNKGWKAQKKHVTWSIGGKKYHATIVRISSNNFWDYVFNISNDDFFSPRYGSYRDALAGAYFYWVKSKKRTSGLLKGEFW
ncbi:leucine-rich repeat domain-containing protein [Prevotella sp. tf2-5]|jgi:hypothetical protein|uniref:leucine-rich repeat domain-containing protein n=1 Tax=Prevotella sp. tf2-5 TaxID=1761889 RepID=UPI000B882C9B|nr:leucine-rich repeat domain-containing protein [Prevotella sp. tf2-5]